MFNLRSIEEPILRMDFAMSTALIEKEMIVIKKSYFIKILEEF